MEIRENRGRGKGEKSQNEGELWAQILGVPGRTGTELLKGRGKGILKSTSYCGRGKPETLRGQGKKGKNGIL